MTKDFYDIKKQSHPRTHRVRWSAASDVYKGQGQLRPRKRTAEVSVAQLPAFFVLLLALNLSQGSADVAFGRGSLSRTLLQPEHAPCKTQVLPERASTSAGAALSAGYLHCRLPVQGVGPLFLCAARACLSVLSGAAPPAQHVAAEV